MTVPDWVEGSQGPPAWSARDNAFIVTRYADTAAALRHPQVQVVELGTEVAALGARWRRTFPNLVNMLDGILVHRNPPAHTSIRSFLRKSLQNFAADFSEIEMRRSAEALLDAIPSGEPVDAMQSLAARFPTITIARALGLDERFVVNVMRIGIRLIGVWHRGLSLRAYERLENEASELSMSLIEQICVQRGTLSGLGRMTALGASEFALSDAEIAAGAFFFIMAGTRTTAMLLGNMMFLLAALPAERERVQADPSLMKACIDETMRFAGPLRHVGRVTRSELCLSNVRIPPGAAINTMLELAHRDPDAYERPECFEIGRRGPPHLGFAAGIHACLGVGLAHLEATTLVSMMFQRFDIELLEGSPQWLEHPLFRELAKLPLVLRPISKRKMM